MESNRKSSKSNGLCERLYKAVSHATPFRRNRKISHYQPAAPNLLSTTPKPPPHKAFDVQPTNPVIHPHKPADSIPINFDFSSNPEHRNIKTSNGHVGTEAAKFDPQLLKEDIPRSVSGINQIFSEYIERKKKEMEIASTVDRESEGALLDEKEKGSHMNRVNEHIQNAE